MKILIDNGHGQTTPGKRSPDGQFLEYKFNREIARRIVADLRDRGYDASLLVPEDEDVSLQERCRRANTVTVFHGKDTVAVLKGLLGSICSMASAQPPPSSRLI